MPSACHSIASTAPPFHEAPYEYSRFESIPEADKYLVNHRTTQTQIEAIVTANRASSVVAEAPIAASMS